MRYFGPQILFYAIWNKGFLDHAHLTDGMQWQKKSKKIDAFYASDVFCESECSSRKSKVGKIFVVAMKKYRSIYNFNPCNLFFKQHKSCLLKYMINHHHPSIELYMLSFLNTGTQKSMIQF